LALTKVFYDCAQSIEDVVFYITLTDLFFEDKSEAVNSLNRMYPRLYKITLTIEEGEL
jgi:hypothetical protein